MASSGRRSTERRRIQVSPPEAHARAPAASGTVQRRGPQGTARPQERELHDSLLGSGTGPTGRPGEQDIDHRYPGAGPDNPEATDRLPPVKSCRDFLQEQKKLPLAAFDAPPIRESGWRYMAQRTGLEPATPGVTGRYSNRLNYRCASAGLSSVSRKSWWLMTGSNRRPPACDAGALPAELISRSPCEARNLRIAQHQVNTGIEFFASGRGQVALVDGFCAAAAPFRRKTVGCTGLLGLSAMCIQPVAAPVAYHRNARVRQQTNKSHARHHQ